MWMFINNTLLGNKVVEQYMYLKNIFVYVLVYRKILEEYPRIQLKLLLENETWRVEDILLSFTYFVFFKTCVIFYNWQFE